MFFFFIIYYYVLSHKHPKHHSSITHSSLSLTLFLTAVSQPAIATDPAHRRFNLPPQPSADLALCRSSSLSLSLFPSPLPLILHHRPFASHPQSTTLHLPPPTDDSDGRSCGSNGRLLDGSSGSKSGSVGHFTWVFRWVWFGLGFPMRLDCFWVGFIDEFWLILS